MTWYFAPPDRMVLTSPVSSLDLVDEDPPSAGSRYLSGEGSEGP